MNTIELMKNTNISYYGNVKYNTSKYTVTLLDWISKCSMRNKDNIIKIRDINKFDEKQAKLLKSQLLPCATISGTFSSYRRMDLIDNINPIICIDIDKNDNEEINDWEKVKNDVFKIDGVFLSSFSCRGEGIYVLVYYNIEKDFIKIWNALNKDFKEILNLNIDKSCKDITRLRFISYDDNIRIKETIKPYDKEIELETETSSYISDDTKIMFEDDFLYKAIYYLIKEDKYTADNYNDWLLNCFRLATLGNYGLILFLLLSANSKNFDYNVAVNQFKECVKRNKMNKTSLLFYLKLLKDKHNDWVNLIYNYKIT